MQQTDSMETISFEELFEEAVRTHAASPPVRPRPGARSRSDAHRHELARDNPDFAGRSAERMLDRLPQHRDRLPDRALLEELLANRPLYEEFAVARLASEVPVAEDEASAVRACWLCAIVGEWRSTLALPALLAHLEAPHLYADEEVLHALTRVGPKAIAPLLFVIFDRDASVRRRTRATHALCSIALAACDFGSDPSWCGDADLQVEEVRAAFRLILERHEVEPVSVVRAAAQALCELQCHDVAAEIDALFARRVLTPVPGFTPELAERILAGELVNLELGCWRTSMLSWLY